MVLMLIVESCRFQICNINTDNDHIRFIFGKICPDKLQKQCLIPPTTQPNFDDKNNPKSNPVIELDSSPPLMKNLAR